MVTNLETFKLEDDDYSYDGGFDESVKDENEEKEKNNGPAQVGKPAALPAA